MIDVEIFKSKQLEILHELDRVCKQHQIHYYLAYGSCLGALRHHGFIPWDDDIDVVMTVPEFERLLSVKDSFKNNYFIQNRDTDPNWSFMSCSIRDSATACFVEEEGTKDANHGVKVDIYLLYPYPDNPIEAHKLIIDSFILRLLYMRICDELPRNHGMLAQAGSKLLMHMYSDKAAEKKIKKIENELKNNKGSKYYSVFFGNDVTLFSALKFPVEMFQEPTYLQFEGFSAPCPTDPDLMCRICYGDSYMEYPPEEKRVSNHDIIYLNCDEPFTAFEGKYYYKDKKSR